MRLTYQLYSVTHIVDLSEQIKALPGGPRRAVTVPPRRGTSGSGGGGGGDSGGGHVLELIRIKYTKLSL